MDSRNGLRVVFIFFGILWARIKLQHGRTLDSPHRYRLVSTHLGGGIPYRARRAAASFLQTFHLCTIHVASHIRQYWPGHQAKRWRVLASRNEVAHAIQSQTPFPLARALWPQQTSQQSERPGQNELFRRRQVRSSPGLGNRPRLRLWSLYRRRHSVSPSKVSAPGHKRGMLFGDQVSSRASIPRNDCSDTIRRSIQYP